MRARPLEAAAVLVAGTLCAVLGVFGALLVLRPWGTPTSASSEQVSGEGATSAPDGVQSSHAAAGQSVKPYAEGPTIDDTTQPPAEPSTGDSADAPTGDFTGSAYFAGIAASVSQQIYPSGTAAEIVLIRDQPTGDALAAGSLIGLFDTTFLLSGSEALPATTAREIDRLGRPRVHILGGPDAIAVEIEDELVAAGHNVHRHHGPTQADTAIDIARAHFPEAGTAVLVRTPDAQEGAVAALSSALAATTMAASRELPMLLTDRATLSASTAEYLDDSVIEGVVVVGSEEEISSEVTDRLDALGIGWTRVGGQNRFENAVEVARDRGFPSARQAAGVVLVEGGHDSVWPAGFLGSVLAAREEGPVLLANGDVLPPSTAAYLFDAPADLAITCTTGVTQRACAAAKALRDGT